MKRLSALVPGMLRSATLEKKPDRIEVDTVVVTLVLGAVAVSSAIFLILEMYRPFSGVLRISPTPILDALSQMGH